MVYTMDPEGKLELVNERLLAFLGATSLAFNEWSHFIHPDDRARVLAVWQSTTVASKPYDVELRLRGSDGVYRWFNSRGTPMRDVEGHVVRWYALLTDINDRKSAEDALRSTETRLSRARQAATVAELSASIAHEINQPLASVVTNAHACQTWLSHDPPNLERALATLERITRDGHSAAEVLRRIRALFKETPPNTFSAATTEAPKNCAKEGARGREHPRNHFVCFGESLCDVHAPPQVSGQGTFGQRYGNWSLHCVDRSGERPRNRSFNGAKYWRLNLR
jgi:PAS domain S-box-containing protein